jgi:hypothetical protein
MVIFGGNGGLFSLLVVALPIAPSYYLVSYISYYIVALHVSCISFNPMKNLNYNSRSHKLGGLPQGRKF